jgi:lipopolysaccharide/colanic/teichoic acid biosynthesis glycosyltransferase
VHVRDWPSKRVFDVLVAGATLVVAAPLLAVASAAIKLESRGPVLFAQVRVGRARRPIRALKLRTMVTEADRAGPQITASGDPRITRIGRWLRKTKLDELPQLWNVLRGDMSLVGPRPEVPRYADTYRPEWEKLFDVRPGVTDLASLTFRNEEALLSMARDREQAYTDVIMPMKLELALRGVERSSLRDDLAVLARTVLVVVRSPGLDEDEILAEARRRIEKLNTMAEDT